MGVPPDPVESLAKGATSAALDWTEQKVRDLAKQFRNRQLAFIKNADNIELIKEERQSSEFIVLKLFVPKGPWSIQVLMGLTLRQIAGDQPRTLALRDRILHKYGAAGLHVAEITQIGITSQLLTQLTKMDSRPDEVKKRLVYFLENIEDLVIFVKRTDVPSAIAKMVQIRLETFASHMMILIGSGYAMDVVYDVLEEIDKDARGYGMDVRREGVQITAFIFTPELRAKFSHWSELIQER